MGIIDFKIIGSLIRKNFIKNIGLGVLYSFLFTIFLALIVSIMVSNAILSSQDSGSYLVIDKDIVVDPQAMNYEFVTTLEKNHPDLHIYPSFILRMPTMMQISFFGKNLETDTFIMGYDPEFYKNNNYDEIDNNEDKKGIGISLSSQSLLVLKNFLFSDINPNTLRFLNGKIIFGKSSLLGNIKGSKTIQENFYIEGISDTLPIYAIAIEIDKAIEISEKFGIQKEDIKLHKLHIAIDNQEIKNKVITFVDKYNKIHKSNYEVIDNDEIIRSNKKKYKQVFQIVYGVLGAFLIISILIITELSLQNTVYNSKNTIKILKYSGLKTKQVFLYFLAIFLFLLIISLILFITISGIIFHFYQTSFITHTFSLDINSIIIILISFLSVFIWYYTISLYIKIKQIHI